MFKYLTLFSFTLLLSCMTAVSQEEKTIIYVWDPLCGWCYGFEPQMEKFQAQNKNNYNFEVIVGGMVLPPNGRPMGQMRNFLLSAIPQLEKTTGIKIEQPYYDHILSKDSLQLFSLTPALVFNFLKPKYLGREVILANTIQILLYQKGKNTNEILTYKELLEANSLNFDDSIVEIKSDDNITKTYQMFKRANELGVTGYPAVLIKTDKGVKQISSGYTTCERLEKQL